MNGVVARHEHLARDVDMEAIALNVTPDAHLALTVMDLGGPQPPHRRRHVAAIAGSRRPDGRLISPTGR